MVIIHNVHPFLKTVRNGGTLVLELNSFYKTVQEAICSKTESPLFPDRHMTDCTGIIVKGLSGRELIPFLCEKLGREQNWSRTKLFKNQVVGEPRFDCARI